MIEADRLIQPTADREDEVIDRAIRPKLLADYTGQDHVCEQMDIFIQAAQKRRCTRPFIDIWAARIRQNNPSQYCCQLNGS